MASFTPPANATEVAGWTADTPPQIRRLVGHSTGNPRGRNVFYLSDGTVTEDDPDAHTVFWFASSPGRTTEPYVHTAWWGSTAAAYEVTSAQATALTNAGYTVV